jgi:hypothetical protein
MISAHQRSGYTKYSARVEPELSRSSQNWSGISNSATSGTKFRDNHEFLLIERSLHPSLDLLLVPVLNRIQKTQEFAYIILQIGLTLFIDWYSVIKFSNKIFTKHFFSWKFHNIVSSLFSMNLTSLLQTSTFFPRRSYLPITQVSTNDNVAKKNDSISKYAYSHSHSSFFFYSVHVFLFFVIMYSIQLTK